MSTIQKPEAPFVPKGAVPVFFAIVGAFGAFWLAMYWVLAVSHVMR